MSEKQTLLKSLDYFKRNGAPIVAEATASGGPICVLRISGKDLKSFAPMVGGSLPLPRMASYRKVANLDQALVLYFEGPKSFTGEDVIEIHCHGIRSFVRSIITECEKLGAQAALPGEFSFRAYLNNKMTLDEAERLNEGLASESIDARAASRMLGFSSGEENRALENLEKFEQKVFVARGRIESAIDFPEAEEEQSHDVEAALNILNSLNIEAQEYLNFYENFAKSINFPRVAIVGETNVGKSTLFNILCGNDRSLVSDIEGTTRDYVEVDFKTSFFKAKLVDTAGLRELLSTEGHDRLEGLGIQQGLSVIEKAEVLVWVKKAGQNSETYSQSLLKNFQIPVIEVFSHADSNNEVSLGAFDFTHKDTQPIKDFLYEKIGNKLQRVNFDQDSILSSRQFRHLKEAAVHIERSILFLKDEEPLEMVASELQETERLIKLCTGRDLGEEYIAQIFSQFCLGK
ncbi:GTP-binding protein [bacterium]|nr:GTP-binding protein [bacterium]